MTSPIWGDVPSGVATATYAWGQNNRGQLGLGFVTPFGTAGVRTPTMVIGTFAAVVSNSQQSLFLTNTGQVYWSGPNSTGLNAGNFSPASTSTPLPLAFTFPIPIIKIGIGFDTQATFAFMAYALDSTKQLWAWGTNLLGQLGNGTNTPGLTPRVIATSVENFAGSFSTVILKTGGIVQTTGSNSRGQLGDGTTTNRSSWTTVTPPTGTVVDVGHGIALDAAGGQTGGTTVVLKSDGTVMGVGCSSAQQLGNTNITNTSWVTIPFLPGVTEIWTDGSGVRARYPDGSAYAIGDNSLGILGVGQFQSQGGGMVNPPRILTRRFIPNGVTLGRFGRTSSTLTVSHVVGSDGRAYVCGPGFSGERGDGSASNVQQNDLTPSPIGLPNIIRTEAGGSCLWAIAGVAEKNLVRLPLVIS